MGTVTKFWDDAMLVAYVDGELDAATARRVEAAIADDPEAQATIRLLRESATAARGAYDEILHAPVPERLVAGVMGRSNRPDSTPAPTVVAFPRKKAAATLGKLRPLAAGLLLLAFGFAGGLYTDGIGGGALHPAAGTGGNAPFEAAIATALAADRIGDAVAYTDDAENAAGSVTVTREFRTGFGADCREFEHALDRMGKRVTENGIACRRADGGWDVLTLSHPSSG